MLTLWDLIRPLRRKKLDRGAAGPAAKGAGRRSRARRAPAESKQALYDRIARQMLEKYGVRVRRWRTAMSGLAWEVHYRDGGMARLIEAPRPKGPMSAAVFLHEIGHHAIGFGRYRPRCLEEYHAWRFAIGAMEAEGILVSEGVKRRMRRSLEYAVAKAQRRGLREIPPELREYAGPLR